MVIGRLFQQLANPIVSVRCSAKKDDSLICLCAVQEVAEGLCARANSSDKNTGCERVEGSSMAELNFDFLILATPALVMTLFGSGGVGHGEPGREEGGGLEVCLEVAEDLCGGDTSWFVDSYMVSLRRVDVEVRKIPNTPSMTFPFVIFQKTVFGRMDMNVLWCKGIGGVGYLRVLDCVECREFGRGSLPDARFKRMMRFSAYLLSPRDLDFANHALAPLFARQYSLPPSSHPQAKLHICTPITKHGTDQLYLFKRKKDLQRYRGVQEIKESKC